MTLPGDLLAPLRVSVLASSLWVPLIEDPRMRKQTEAGLEIMLQLFLAERLRNGIPEKVSVGRQVSPFPAPSPSITRRGW